MRFLLLACLLVGMGRLFAVAKPSQEEKVYLHFDNNRSAKAINISAETVTSTGMMGVLNQ